MGAAIETAGSEGALCALRTAAGLSPKSHQIFDSLASDPQAVAFETDTWAAGGQHAWLPDSGLVSLVVMAQTRGGGQVQNGAFVC